MRGRKELRVARKLRLTVLKKVKIEVEKVCLQDVKKLTKYFFKKKRQLCVCNYELRHSSRCRCNCSGRGLRLTSQLPLRLVERSPPKM